MKALFVPLVLAAGALSAFGTFACGGGQALTLEEYFEKIDALFEDVDEKVETLSAECIEQYGATIQFVSCFSDGSLDIYHDALDELDAFNPPLEAEAAHEQFLDARGGEQHCLPLQGIADENNIDIELGCEGGPLPFGPAD